MLSWQCLLILFKEVAIYITELQKYPVFIMAMPLNMILVVCHTMYIVT